MTMPQKKNRGEKVKLFRGKEGFKFSVKGAFNSVLIGGKRGDENNKRERRRRFNIKKRVLEEGPKIKLLPPDEKGGIDFGNCHCFEQAKNNETQNIDG